MRMQFNLHNVLNFCQKEFQFDFHFVKLQAKTELLSSRVK